MLDWPRLYYHYYPKRSDPQKSETFLDFIKRLRKIHEENRLEDVVVRKMEIAPWMYPAEQLNSHGAELEGSSDSYASLLIQSMSRQKLDIMSSHQFILSYKN